MPEVANIFENIDFVDDNEAAYFAEAQLGQQVLDFLRSATGRLLHGRAQQVIDQAKIDLLELDLDAEDGISQFKKLKNEAHQAQSFMRWCAEAIQNGQESEVQLEEYRD